MIGKLLHSIHCVIRVFTGYYLFQELFVLLIFLGRRYRKSRFPHIYLKEFPIHLNHKTIERIRFICQFFFTAISFGIVTFITLNNIAPFGATVFYSLAEKNDNISVLGPKNRVSQETVHGETITRQTHDLIYFSTKMPFHFDTATVHITFQNPDPDQTLTLGFHNQADWNYDKALIDAPLLNSLSWKRVGNNPTLYEKQFRYQSVSDFLSHPPKDALIGTYMYDTDIGNIAYTHLSNYKPSVQDTIIDMPLRGRHVLYAYLQNEPFKMTIEKQDLNWHSNPDVMTVNIYKGKDLVFQETAGDDGIVDGSRASSGPTELTVKNPGPELPESGVYKIVIDTGSDTIIKQIRTNLHKIIFQGPLFLAGNSQAYHPVVASTSATTLYTNAVLLSALTYHTSGLQDITATDKILRVNAVKSEVTLFPQHDFTHIFIPKNDVVLNGFYGYFSFTKDQFFLPTDYHILPVSTSDDLDYADYILTDYIPTQNVNGWQVAEHTFDIRSAYIENGKLTWILQAPKLNENNRSILIKDITVSLHKNSWF